MTFDTGPLEGRVIAANNVPDFESLRRAREAFTHETARRGGVLWLRPLT